MPEKIPQRDYAFENAPEATVLSPEHSVETHVETEHQEEPIKLTRRQKRRAASAEHAFVPVAVSHTPDPEVREIESILASGLDTFFIHLSPEHQQNFKTQGETTALKIKDALRKPSTRVKDIVNLIINWLKGLPGINRFFLEQEAKIKADTIMRRYRS